jgi:hypothetical protein
MKSSSEKGSKSAPLASKKSSTTSQSGRK